MEDKLYSIGEVAKIMGISVPLLRHYCDIHLIEPEYVNEETGYRYFSYRQIPYIDRTRYLLTCGLQLKEIKEILEKDDPKALRELLEEKEAQKRKELERIQESIERIAWYRRYFARENLELESEAAMKIKTLPPRYMIAVPCLPEESYEDMHIHLHQVRHLPEYADLTFMRQFSILLDYPALIRGKFLRRYLGMYIREPGPENLQYQMVIPAGDYLCFRGRVLSDGWDPEPIRSFFQERKEEPTLVVAEEFENSFREYDDSIFEVQMKL